MLRKLKQSEHDRTRRLWEEVFTEDSRAFLDYYYYIKTRDNQIHVIEEDGDICSMLQLNPYKVIVEGGEFPSAYVVAVATKAEYRRRGIDPIGLKAVATPHNLFWTVCELTEELEQERAAMQAMSRNREG